jgi:tRNA(Ile)-lysidine synthase TilS/MesJ
MYDLEIRGHDLFDDVLSNCFDKEGNPTKPIKIVLTVAHLNHDIADNSDDNLAALCQLHHLRHDIDHHRANAKETNRKKKGLQNLF